MKKSLFFRSFLILVFVPAYMYAQEIELPAIEIRGSRDNVPYKVKEAFMNDFGEGHRPFVWATPQVRFVAGNLEQNDIENTEVIYYAIHVTTTSGCSLDALYTSDGKLVRSREYLKNFVPPQPVLAALQSSDYKNWVINRNFHIIKVASNRIEKERFALVMKKGNTKKTIYLDPNGAKIINKKELAELVW